MTVNRGETFFLRNDTTIDTGASVDIRHLASSQSGTNDITQTITVTHANDNVERMFDPATAGGLAADATLLNRRGWGLRVTEDMTPEDDTNCDVMIPANTTTVTLNVAVGWDTTIGANPNPTFRASLWRYNPSTDAGTLIASGSNVAASPWQALSENGTFKNATISITVPQTTFSQGQILMMQVGLNTGTLPNPITGTTNYTITLRIDNATTRIAFASGTHLLQVCSLTNGLTGVGTVTKNPLPITIGAKNLTAVGTPSFSRVPTLSKTFNLNGVGTPSYTKVTTAFRTFNLSARGEILTSGSNASTITVPIDEIPEAGAGGGDTYIFPVLD